MLDGTSPIPYNTISVTHRKLVTYVTFADRQENMEQQGTASSIGHGTHVASTLVGNSGTSAGTAMYNGIAPNSKVRGLFICVSVFIYVFSCLSIYLIN